MPSTNEMSHQDIWKKLHDLVKADEYSGTDKFVFVNDVFGDYFIYEVENKDGSTLFKRGYSIGANDEVTLSEEKQEVEQRVTFVPVGNTSNQTKGGNTMERKDKVDALISNEKLEWAEEDRESLMGMNDKQFAIVEKGAEALLAANEESKGEKKEEPKDNEEGEKGKGPDGDGETGNEDKPKDNKDEGKDKETAESVIDNVQDPETKATLQRAVARDKKIKDGMVKELTSNEACGYTEEQLNGKDIEELEILIKMLGSEKTAEDFSVRSPAPSVNVEGDVPEMPVLFANKDKK